MQNKKRFHIDFWIGTSIAVAILLGIFLAYPLMSLLIRAFRDSSSGAFTMANFVKFFSKRYYLREIGRASCRERV